MTRPMHAGERRPCDVPRCGSLGRLFSCGWRCDSHRPGANLGRRVPTPDPTRTATAIAQEGHTKAMQRNALAALRLYVDPDVLREALEAAIRQHRLSTV